MTAFEIAMMLIEKDRSNRMSGRTYAQMHGIKSAVDPVRMIVHSSQYADVLAEQYKINRSKLVSMVQAGSLQGHGGPILVEHHALAIILEDALKEAQDAVFQLLQLWVEDRPGFRGTWGSTE